MDPDETLRQLRAAITDYQHAVIPAAAQDAADRIADHAEALDDWLSRGGYAPAAWQPLLPPA